MQKTRLLFIFFRFYRPSLSFVRKRGGQKMTVLIIIGGVKCHFYKFFKFFCFLLDGFNKKIYSYVIKNGDSNFEKLNK